METNEDLIDRRGHYTGKKNPKVVLNFVADYEL